METPTNYADVSQRALDVAKEHNLTQIQTYLYDHICRGDFYLRNSDGQKFYDPKNNGFGWSGDRNWVKRQFKKLIDANLVVFDKLHDCRDARYTSWVFFCPEFDYSDLVDASCYATVHKLFMIKHYLNIPDGFDHKYGVYGDGALELTMRSTVLGDQYTFKYKGEGSVYSWDHSGKGEKSDLTWLVGQPTWKEPQTYESFSDMVHDIWSFMAHDGNEYLYHVPNTTVKYKR